MAISKATIFFMTLVFVTSMTGCGGNDNMSRTISDPAQSGDLPGGLWKGTITFDSGETLEAVGLVSEPFIYDEFFDSLGSNFLITDEHGQQVAGELWSAGTTTTDSTTFLADGEWALPVDASNSTTITQGQGTVSLSGTVMERDQLTGSFQDQEDTFAGTFVFAYDPLYEQDSAISTIAGTYSDGSNQLTIDSQGNMFGQDAATGCVLNGKVSVLDSQYNYYLVDFDLAACSGEEAILNGLEFSGAAFLDGMAASDEVLTIRAADDARPERYTGVNMSLVRQ